MVHRFLKLCAARKNVSQTHKHMTAAESLIAEYDSQLVALTLPSLRPPRGGRQALSMKVTFYYCAVVALLALAAPARAQTPVLPPDTARVSSATM